LDLGAGFCFFAGGPLALSVLEAAETEVLVSAKSDPESDSEAAPSDSSESDSSSDSTLEASEPESSSSEPMSIFTFFAAALCGGMLPSASRSKPGAKRRALWWRTFFGVV